MARESKPRKRGLSKTFWKRNFPKTSLFGIWVIAAARESKPPQWLAEKAQCTVQQANNFISGRSRPSARAILALFIALLDQDGH